MLGLGGLGSIGVRAEPVAFDLPAQPADTALLAFARQAKVEPPDDLMMTSDEVRTLRGAGMQIGAHTVTHPILAPGRHAAVPNWSARKPMSRRAKIVCTLGPATDPPERMRALMEAGMDVARVNC